jgi:hypothetical protein
MCTDIRLVAQHADVVLAIHASRIRLCEQSAHPHPHPPTLCHPSCRHISAMRSASSSGKRAVQRRLRNQALTSALQSCVVCRAHLRRHQPPQSAHRRLKQRRRQWRRPHGRPFRLVMTKPLLHLPWRQGARNARPCGLGQLPHRRRPRPCFVSGCFRKPGWQLRHRTLVVLRCPSMHRVQRQTHLVRLWKQRLPCSATSRVQHVRHHLRKSKQRLSAALMPHWAPALTAVVGVAHRGTSPSRSGPTRRTKTTTLILATGDISASPPRHRHTTCQVSRWMSWRGSTTVVSCCCHCPQLVHARAYTRARANVTVATTVTTRYHHHQLLLLLLTVFTSPCAHGNATRRLTVTEN